MRIFVRYRAPELLLGSETYGPPIDLWAAGCILGELIRHSPLLPGKNEAEQIGLIFALRGSPREDVWPGLSRLPGSTAALRGSRRGDLHERFMDWGADGVDFLAALLTMCPERRPTARAALDHPYFRSRPLPQKAEFMPTWPSRHGDLKGEKRQKV